MHCCWKKGDYITVPIFDPGTISDDTWNNLKRKIQDKDMARDGLVMSLFSTLN
jgi:hypothetical protein